jgi:hypothetical protein
VSRVRDSLTKASDACQDLVGSFRPDERLGVRVGQLGVTVDRELEFAGAAVHAPAELFLRERREPALDKIDPGGAGRREVQMEARVARQPPVNRGRLA